MKRICGLLLLFCTLVLSAQERETIWPSGKMPSAQPGQIAAMTDEAGSPGFNPDDHRVAYLEWFEAPENPCGSCMILISGGGYDSCCDVGLIDLWHKTLTERGVQCVNFVYRTPRPVGLPIYQTAWEDGQRAVRMVRSEAARRGFDPERIGAISMSAGSHLALLLATSSQTPAYEPVDGIDDLPCHLNWAIVNAPAYVTTDAESGIAATREGYGTDVALSSIFHFDGKTCPMSLHHGGMDIYSPNGSTLVYRELRKRGIPAELHLYPNRGHGAYGLERGLEFMTQMGYLGPVGEEVDIMSRFPDDDARGDYLKQDLWPEGKIPDFRQNQRIPYLEWHFPKHRTTDAIQIIYSGGGYHGNAVHGFEVAPARRYLNAMGVTVVTMIYRTPRPEGLAKHTTAWQDVQRAVRLVRRQAASYGLNPKRIGIMGSSAGGHLTLMGVTSSRHRSYSPVDEADALPCNVQWGIGIYPAYALTDGLDVNNTTGGNDDSAVLAPEFSFDPDTSPMLFIHGDSDAWASMNSVKAWEKMRAMGVQSELHTLATREHCFQRTASPGTGSYTWLDRIAEFLKEMDLFPAPAAPSASNIVYTDAAEFPLYGKVCDDTPRRYNRLPASLEGELKETLWNLGKNSAGEYIRFRTDSPVIKFKWENTGNFRMAHMSETGIKGLDLYTLTPQGWRFVHSAVPWSGKKNEYKAIGNMTPEMREYMLYLPLYDGIDSLWIGIEEGYSLEQPAVARPVSRKPIVAYGTSILQGGCVSRPGMVHTSIIGRRLDREVINLGFSGSAHLEPQIAEWMCRVEDPGVFVLDYTENTTPAELDSLQEGFFRILRQHHPDVPIVFVEHVHFPYIYLDTKEAESVRIKNEKLKAFYEKMKKEGQKNLFYVPADKMIGDDGEATVDGIHLTDVGMLRYADLVTPYIRKALDRNK